MTKAIPKTLLFPLVAYSAASTLHFVHNAMYLESYPNMPGWISGAVVFAALNGLLALGLAGYLLIRAGYRLPGLFTIAIYAGLGFDGLAHYTLAPVSTHTMVMNFTIWFEVATAGLLLVVVVALVPSRVSAAMSERKVAGQ